MSPSPLLLRDERERRRHIMATLFWEHNVSIARIAKASGMRKSTAYGRIQAHFPEHCSVCKASVTNAG